MKKIVLTGGGTAGHVMPNLALVPELKKHFDKIYYIGSNGVEKEIISKHNIDFYEINATKLYRKKILKNIKLPFVLISSIFNSKKILKQLQPDVVFSKGGFVSLPVVIAAKKLKIPVISHESDLSMGLANKIILRYANKVVTSFEETAKKCKKCVFVGSPIRDDIFKGNKELLLKKTNFSTSKKTLLFFGGSLGAQKINQVLLQALPSLVKTYNILHITGKGNKQKFQNNSYFQTEFTQSIQDYFALADLVVCRAGANSLFELLALEKPMILIPLSKKASRGDQIENAKYFKERNFANVIYEEELDKNMLIKTVENTNLNFLKSNIQKHSGKSINKEIVTIILNEIK